MAAGTEQSLDAVRRLARGVCNTPVALILVPGAGKASPGCSDAISRDPRVARVYACGPRAPGESARAKAHCGTRRMRHDLRSNGLTVAGGLSAPCRDPTLE